MNNENAFICGKCGGTCFKHMPGACFPEDFNNSIENVKTAILSKRYVLDYWEGDPRDKIPKGKKLSKAFFVRPAMQDSYRWPVDASWGMRPCVFLTAKGCTLTFEERPTECRLLEPCYLPAGCHTPGSFSKRDAAIAWLPYTAALQKLIRQAQKLETVSSN